MGGAVLVSAAFVFMLQSWALGDDVSRYLHLLGFTGVLTGAGFFCALRMREDKGARTFLGLAAASVPVHFTVLGALLYSQLPWLSDLAEYPDYARFSAPDPAAAILVTALGVAALVPVCWIAFLTLARPEARRLSVGYLLANATLLVPTRHPDVIGLLALALLAGVVAFDRAVLCAPSALRTLEGRAVRAMMAVPFAVLVGRTFNLYEPSALFWASLQAGAAFGLFTVLPGVLRTRGNAVFAQHLALVPTAGAWLCVLHALDAAVGVDAALALPLLVVPLALALGALSVFAIDGGRRMRALATLVATAGMTLQLVLHPGVATSFASLATAIVAAAHGLAARHRSVLAMGLGALGLGLLLHLRHAAELYALSPWGALAVLGTLTVLAASAAERHGAAVWRSLGPRWRRALGPRMR
jgi:hypothetical protein